MGVARHHHYLPQFYLRSFSVSDLIFAYDVKRNLMFRTSPRNVAGERDLYRLEGSEPLLAEKMFSEIESAVAPILNRIVSNRALPISGSGEMDTFLYFLAVLFARHPAWLNNIEGFTKRVLEHAVSLTPHTIPLGQTKTLHDGQLITKEDAIKAVEAMEEGRIRIHVPRDHSLSIALKGIDGLFKALRARNWNLGFSQHSLLTTSSKPLLLTWHNLEWHSTHPPGFGHEKTTVYLPLSPQLLLVGRFESGFTSGSLPTGFEAAVNAMQFIGNPHYLFASNPKLPVQVDTVPVPFDGLTQYYQSKRNR